MCQSGRRDARTDDEDAYRRAGATKRGKRVNTNPMPRPRCCLADRDTVNRDPMPRSRCRCYLGHIRPRTDSRQLSTAFLPPKRRHSGVRLLSAVILQPDEVSGRTPSALALEGYPLVTSRSRPLTDLAILPESEQHPDRNLVYVARHQCRADNITDLLVQARHIRRGVGVDGRRFTGEGCVEAGYR